MRQTLAQPALHPSRGHQNQFLGEGIGRRHGEQLAEAVGEQICAVGTMEVKRHRPPHYDAADRQWSSALLENCSALLAWSAPHDACSLAGRRDGFPVAYQARGRLAETLIATASPAS